MSKPEFVYVTYIKTTPTELWQALTKKEFTEKYWFRCDLVSDWKVGSKMHMNRDGQTLNECVILESDPPRRLAYSWLTVSDEDMKKEKPSRVTFVIEEAYDGSKLTVTHEGFSEASKTLPTISNGWPLVLSNLKSFVETGRPLAVEKVCR